MEFKYGTFYVVIRIRRIAPSTPGLLLRFIYQQSDLSLTVTHHDKTVGEIDIKPREASTFSSGNIQQ